ncbi:MAG: outer membrane beta-barrel family protein [Arcicella sp.]|nr:outer membrane beta-barrel family protein [Arcicella sp.]
MKTKFEWLMLILFGIISFNVKAQHPSGVVTGKVMDNAKGEPLFNVSVLLSNNRNKAVFSTLSDENGRFYLSKIDSGVYTLSLRSLGYENYANTQIVVRENTVPDSIIVQLIPAFTALEEVSVSASTLKPFVENKDGIMIVNVAKNPLSAGDNALDILLRSPGISEQNGGLNFRGKTVNVLIEGKLLYLDESELKNMLNSMPANSIEKIEIMANPPAKYDANGGSVINIILKKSKRNGLNGSVLSGFGSGIYSKWVEGINVFYRSKKLNLFGGYDFESSKQYINTDRKLASSNFSMMQEERETRAKKNNSFKLGFEYDLSVGSKIGFSYLGINNGLEGLGDVKSNTYLSEIKKDSSSISRIANNGYVNNNLSMYYSLKIDSTGRQLSFNAGYTDNNKRRNDDLRDRIEGNYLGKPFLNSNIRANTNSYSTSLDYVHPTPIGKFEIGVKYQDNRSDNANNWNKYDGNQWLSDSTKSNHFTYREYISAGYVSYSKVFSTKYSLRVGLRAENTLADGLLQETNQRITRDYLNIFPNVSFQYTKNVNHIFALDYRRSIDRFGFNILNPFVSYIGQNLYSQGNSNIQPQINNNVELTYTLKNNYMLGMSYTRTENAVAAIYLQRNGATISTFENQKYADLFYVYVNGSHAIVPEWTITADLGTGFLEYATNNNLTGIYNSKWSYRFELNNSIQLNNSWSIQLNGVLFGPYSTGFYKVKQNLTTTFGIGKTVMNNRGNLNLAVKDIFNTDRQITYFENNGLLTNQSVKKESRFITMTFSYRFGNKKVKPSKVKLKSEVENRINE